MIIILLAVSISGILTWIFCLSDLDKAFKELDENPFKSE